MKKDTWKARIKKACEEAGTYKPIFDSVISTLAAILEKRDDAEEQYRKSGGKPVVMHTNKGGASNIVKNPMLSVWDDMNKSALAYWRDLGLTPAGLKRINEDVFVKTKEEKNSNNLITLLREKRAANG